MLISPYPQSCGIWPLLPATPNQQICTAIHLVLVAVTRARAEKGRQDGAMEEKAGKDVTRQQHAKD